MKECCRCKLVLEESQFNKKANALQPFCRACQSKRHKAWYEKNQIARRAQVKIQRKTTVDEVTSKIEELKKAPCLDCGLTYRPWQMDFDHLGNKDFSISQGRADGYSWKKIEKEIAKCELVCANCHRTRTHNRLFGPFV